MWDAEFFELMPSSIGFRKVNGTTADLYGKRTHAAAINTRGRWEPDEVESTDVEGDRRALKGKVYVPAPAFWALGADLTPVANGWLVTTDDKLVLPDGVTVKITGVLQENDEDGLHHLKVLYG